MITRVTDAIRGKAQRSATRILVVGAGGIGCQVVKNLYKCGLQLVVMDYDTIALSNLNRQFCYRQADIGRYKVDVLQEYFTGLDPNTSIRVEKGNLYEYDELYFGQFGVLVSALDNHEARWHLNEMAIDHSIAMIDAGTAGYNGQVQCFIRHVSECRMCRPQPTEQAPYAVCLLRGRPQRNVHCVQFAVNLFEDMKHIVKRANQLEGSEKQKGVWAKIEQLFTQPLQQYSKDQLKLISIKVHDIIFHSLVTEAEQPDQVTPIKFANEPITIENSKDESIAEWFTSQQEQYLSQKTLPTQLFSLFFVEGLTDLLCSAFLQGSYDKDDASNSIFVFAAANLRALNFMGCPGSKLSRMSYYECKDMSGKIVPAIASTNSIAAALETTLMLETKSGDPKLSYLSIKGFSPVHKVEAYLPYRPKVACPHCSPLHIYCEVEAQMDTVTWGQLEQCLQSELDPTLAGRDMRCNQFIILRNRGPKKWQSNRGKVIGHSAQLVKMSKMGLRTVTIKYTIEEECCGWKFVVIHNNATEAIRIRDKPEKLKCRLEGQKLIQQMKKNQYLREQQRQQEEANFQVMQVMES